MVSPDDDRILYDDPGEDVEVARRGPIAVGLVALSLAAGIVYISSTASAHNEGSPALKASESVSAPRSGFDASSSDFELCDGTRRSGPDFSIVVAGTATADGQQFASRVVQFVVVDSDPDPRYGRNVPAQSLCTLP